MAVFAPCVILLMHENQFKSDDRSDFTLFRLILSLWFPNASLHIHTMAFLSVSIYQSYIISKKSIDLMRNNHSLLGELNGLGLICIELEEKVHQDLD